MNNVNWDYLRSFLAVVNEGSFIAAAKSTGVSQPTLGRHVDHLEAQMSIRLLNRTKTGTALTDAGLALVDDVREMAARADSVSRIASGHSQNISGVVRITASEVVSAYMLPKIFQKLQEKIPEIDIELVATNAVENLLARDADIAIRMVRPMQNDLIARKVNELEIGCFAHQDYLKKNGIPNSIDTLFGHVLIGYDRSDLIVKTMKAMNIKGGRDLFSYRTDNQIAYWEIVKAGVGIGFSPLCVAKKNPEIVRIMPELAIEPLPMWVASHVELKTNRRIRIVNDFLCDELRSL